MSDAIGDTGPILHLHEISRQRTLAVFSYIHIPDLVAEELEAYGLNLVQEGIAGLEVSVFRVDTESWQAYVRNPDGSLLQPADAQVFALAKAERFEKTVLTDDLALRRRIEAQNGIAVGSIGILIRAYRIGQLQRSELDEAIEALFQHSTLYLSRPFRAYIQRLLESLL